AEKDNERHTARRYSLYRDLVIFSLIAATGLRISEALRIQRSDLNWTEFSIKILGKGSRERIIYFGIERLKLLLRELLTISEQLGVQSTAPPSPTHGRGSAGARSAPSSSSSLARRCSPRWQMPRAFWVELSPWTRPGSESLRSASQRRLPGWCHSGSPSCWDGSRTGSAAGGSWSPRTSPRG
ncbi:MAG: tyrosine-type recombinase/integrase, partial [Spirochaetes bacterium]|nr:tyrosine-type recombinase/integrase [Spirochaetota bacterium]